MNGSVPGTMLLVIVVACCDDCTYELWVGGLDWFTNTPASQKVEKVIYDPCAESVQPVP